MFTKRTSDSPFGHWQKGLLFEPSRNLSDTSRIHHMSRMGIFVSRGAS
jgi:hypothetical protein